MSVGHAGKYMVSMYEIFNQNLIKNDFGVKDLHNNESVNFIFIEPVS